MTKALLWQLFSLLKRKESFWLPTVYFTRGLPYVIVFLLSSIFFNRMGLSNGDITLLTSFFFLPLILRPLLGRLVSSFFRKRYWILLMQLVMAFSMYGVAWASLSKHAKWLSILFFFITAAAAVVHDVAVARIYKLSRVYRRTKILNPLSFFLMLSLVLGMSLPLALAGNMEVIGRNVSAAWQKVFYTLSFVFLVFFVYHAFVIPAYQGKTPVAIGKGLTQRWWNETRKTFMQLPHYVALLAFLFFFLIPEGMFFRIAPLFFIDPGSNGGLSFSPQELGLVYGSVGGLAALMGCAVGIKTIQRFSFERSLWLMTCAITFPKLLYIYLSFHFVTTLSVVNVCVAIERFGFGFGIMAYVFLLIYCSQGRYSTFRYSVASAIAAFSAMLSGWFTGVLQENVGYQRFFVLVALVNLLPFIVVFFLRKGKANH